MGKVVLDLKMREAQFLSVPGGVEIRVEVGYHNLGINFKEMFKQGDGFLEILVVLVFIQVA